MKWILHVHCMNGKNMVVGEVRQYDFQFGGQ